MHRYLHLDVVFSMAICGLLIAMPLAFGAIHRGVLLTAETALCLMGVLFALRELKPGPSPNFLSGPLYWLPFALFFTLVGIQMIPMPTSLAGVLSPRLPALYQMVFFPDPIDMRPLSLDATGTAESAIFIFCMIVVFCITRRLCLTQEGFLRKVCVLVVCVGTAEAAYGLINYLMGGTRMLWFAVKGSADHVRGTFINRNHFTGYLVLAISLTLGLCMQARDSQAIDRKRGMFLCAIGLLGMAAAVVLSHSRMGILSMGMAVLIFATLGGKRVMGNPKVFAGVAIAVTAAIALISMDKGLEVFLFRLKELNPSWEHFKFNRLMVWSGSVAVIRDFPWVGTGMGTFQHIYQAYSKELFHVWFATAHNDWLQLMVEAGLLGLGLVLTSLIWFLVYAKRRLRGLQGESRWLAIGLFSGILAFSIQNLVHFNFHMPSNAMLFTVFLALLAHLVSPRMPHGIPDYTQAHPENP